MTQQEFIAKWRAAYLKERSASQSHFNDLCALLGIEDPISADPKGEWFTFEKGATKTSGGEGWADVWRKDCFAWEYKGRQANLDKAFDQLLRYSIALESPPLLIVSDMGRINELRENWLNPCDLIRREAEVVAGYPDRLLPANEIAAKELAKRTLTNLYNARPAWLGHAHHVLDEAVAEAYGWGDDFRSGMLTDDEALARLFRLNQQRASS